VRCRVCAGRDLDDVIDLGPMPLVNGLLPHRDHPCPRHPLRVVCCRRCRLGQLTETVRPDLMFRDYCYFSSQARTTIRHARRLVAAHVRPGDRVVEIASNDGYLLQHAAARGATVLGVDPARNVVEAARAAGVPTECAYFNRETAGGIMTSFGAADVIFANNVLAHVPDPHEMVAGIAILLAEDGVAHVEVPDFGCLLSGGAFDTIYHEHASYFSLGSLRTLFAQHDLAVVGVDLIDIHGGSWHLRVTRLHHAPRHAPRHATRAGDTGAVDAACDRETTGGRFGPDVFSRFRAGVDEAKRRLLADVDGSRSIGAYGAAAKGVVRLNAFGLDCDRIPWVADASPHKQGRYIPGTGQPVVAPARLLEEQPEACLLLAWNLEDEIAAANRSYLDRGGVFLTPRPRAIAGAGAAARPSPVVP